MTRWSELAAAIAAATGEPFRVREARAVSGGCINSALILSDGRRDCFVKLNDAERLAMFEAEAEGLRELARAGALRVPRPIAVGVAGAQCYLAMERLDLGGRLDGAMAGQQLARLHRCSAERYGWHRDNTIGATPQHNAWNPDWVAFWRERRLGFQLDLAVLKGPGASLREPGARLQERLGQLIGHRPPPALLHGDLWGGNIGASVAGEPVIFDPAVYFGDREADLAMTELFGGFGADFHAAYRDVWPLDESAYAVRKTLYNLYHVLNHLNLFGGGYLAQAERMVAQLLAEVG